MNIIKNINELARKSQKKTIILVLAFIGVLVFFGWSFGPSKLTKASEEHDRSFAKMDGTTDSQFTQDASQKVLEEQHREIKDLNEQLKGFGDQLDFLQKTLDEKNVADIGNSQELVQNLQVRIEELEDALHKKSSGQSNTGLVNGIGAEQAARGITSISFSYEDEARGTIETQKIRTAKDYVPPGTFAKAVLLSGADTNAGAHGQTDTTPITMRILDNGTLPNGEHSSLKGCFVTAAAYGDASSERGQIRLQRLSCVRKPDGQILDVPIEGTINDMGGSDGIRGQVVMRNNKLIWNAGVSGVLSGVGSAMQQSMTTQSISPLGATSSIKSGKVFQHGAYGGANTALGKLADYYIKLADMYHPIIQVHAGSEVNIVFLKGFSLIEGQMNIEADRGKNSDNNKDEIPQQLMQTIKNSQLGQEVNMNDSGEMQ